jgi:hypothetical protein
MALYDIKPGVVWNPSAELARAAQIAQSIYAALGVPYVVTSGTDGKHSAGSLHYSCGAMDIRRWDLDRAGKTATAVSQLRGALGRNFDVILESDHIHVEFDPKDGSTPSGCGSSPIAANGDASEVFAGLSTPVIVALVIGAFFLLRR